MYMYKNQMKQKSNIYTESHTHTMDMSNQTGLNRDKERRKQRLMFYTEIGTVLNFYTKDAILPV